MKHIKQQDVLDAIKDSGGIISTIARRLHCNWNTAKASARKPCSRSCATDSKSWICSGSTWTSTPEILLSTCTSPWASKKKASSAATAGRTEFCTMYT